MQTSRIKTYAPKPRRDFIAAVTRRAAMFGLTAKGASPVREEGQLVLIEGQPYPKAVGVHRRKPTDRSAQQGFEQVMEAAAYTWFNRFAAVRYMELHGYLEHSFRVLSHPAGNGLLETLEHAHTVDLPGLDRERVITPKMDGTQDEALCCDLLLAQCCALHQAMPFLFEPVDDETELLLPDNLLQTDSLIRELVTAIPQEHWQEIEIIGWLYQFYISEKKDQVIGKVVKSEDIPAATQLASSPTGSSSTWSRTRSEHSGWRPTRTHRSRRRWRTTSSPPSRRRRSRPSSPPSRRRASTPRS